MSACPEEGADNDCLCTAGWGACQGCRARTGLGVSQNKLGFLTLRRAQVPYKLIDVGAPFSAAFLRIPGWHWVAYLVSVGAVFGLGTVRTVGIKPLSSRHPLLLASHASTLWPAHRKQAAWHLAACRRARSLRCSAALNRRYFVRVFVRVFRVA